VDIATMLGAFGLFGVLFLLFCRYLPMIAIAEVKSVMPEANPHWEGYAKGHAHHGGAHHGHGGAPAGSQPAFQDPRPGQP
jgi:molybdopterin-containing oxidoreductase family membrane subunit